MKRLRTLLGFGMAWLLLGCPTSPRRDVFNYRHQVITFKIDPAAADHPFCASDTTFPTPFECRQASKYRLSWQRPEDTVGLVEYRVYLDTNPPDAPGRSWEQVRQDRALATLILPGAGGPLNGPMDSVIFAVASGGFRTDTLTRGEARIIALDTTGRIDSLGQLVFAIVTPYRESGADGLPSYSWMITDDRFAPHPVQPRFTARDSSLEIAWSRPLDHTSFFDLDPAADTGMIGAYVLQVARGGVSSANRPGMPFNPAVRFFSGGTDRSALVTSAEYVSNGPNGVPGARAFRFILPDSQRVLNRSGPDPRDSLAVIVSGLSPLDTVDLFLWPVDTAGNRADTARFTRILLTDTTEPLAPRLRLLDSAGRNRLVYGFTASRDQVESGTGGLVPASTPNANIREYRVRRAVIGGYAGGTQNEEFIIAVNGANRGDTLFPDTMRFLPPGTTYRVTVQAVDSTGHLSPRDSLDITTLSVRFPGPDSASTCPSGFLPMPTGRFLLGDTSVDANSDERNGARRRFLGSFCIEAYEHKDSTGVFQAKATWSQADQACRDHSPLDSTHLCSETEWERACEGIDSAAPLLYGVQSEKNNPGSLRFTCNIGIGDSAMALTPALRDPACLTYEGAFDLSGNLSEWVADRYAAGAYASAGDTLFPGTPLVPPAPDSLHAFRGRHYLLDSISPTTTLRLARCSNRDYPLQIRPRPYPGCIDTAKPLLAVTYNSAVQPPRCLPIPDSLLGRNISSVAPARDSTQILFFLAGVTQPVVYVLPQNDTNYSRLRPIDAKLTPLALAAVTFVNAQTSQVIADTLDATEILRDTSLTALTAIFNREVSAPWSARQTGGRYEIRYLYAHSRLGGVSARPHYSNAALGFRCCSRPRP